MIHCEFLNLLNVEMYQFGNVVVSIKTAHDSGISPQVTFKPLMQIMLNSYNCAVHQNSSLNVLISIKMA